MYVECALPPNQTAVNRPSHLMRVSDEKRTVQDETNNGL